MSASKSVNDKVRLLCKKGEFDELTNLLKESAEDPDLDVNSVSAYGWTCLREVIIRECQFTKIAEILLENGAEVNWPLDANGEGPLHEAVRFNCAENVDLLIKRGADVNLRNSNRQNSIHLAEDSQILKSLLENGAEIDAKDDVGCTALHYAVLTNDLEKAKLLIERGANPNLPNKIKDTALKLAKNKEMRSILRGKNRRNFDTEEKFVNFTRDANSIRGILKNENEVKNNGTVKKTLTFSDKIDFRAIENPNPRKRKRRTRSKVKKSNKALEEE